MAALAGFDAHARLTGQADYTADLTAPDQLHMVVFRSPVAHGEIRLLDGTAAAAMPGVKLIVTAEDLAKAGVRPMALRAPLIDTDGPFHEPRRPVLAEDKVAYVGQPVAAIVAETPEQAQDAAEAVDLEIDELPAVHDITTAHDGAQIWDTVPDNRSFRWTGGNARETAAAFEQARVVYDSEVDHPRIAISPVENRAVLATFADGQYTLTTPSQGVIGLRTALTTCLGLTEGTLRVVTPNVGGSFAVKIWPYPEQALVLFAARRTGRPVKWESSRGEAFLSDIGGRARRDRGRLALNDEGTFEAFEINARADMGAFLNTAAPNIVSANSIRPFNQVYKIPCLTYRVEAMLTNAVPTDAYRGAGKPECAHVLERLIDLAADGMGVDRLELRRRNLITPDDLPYRTAVGETYDGGDFPRILNMLEEAGDWPGVAARKAASAAKGFLRGAGIGFTLHATGGSAAERSEVRAMPDGTVIVRTSSQDSGQSHRETLAVVASRVLEIAQDRIRVEQGDSAHLETGGGTGGSNLMPVAANTVHRTALDMLERAKDRAAEMLEVARVDILYGGGDFWIAGTDRRVSLARIAEETGDEDDPGCVSQLDFEGIHTTFPNGAMLCEVEIDPETGVTRLDRFICVNDVGEVFHPQAAEGQIHGGLAQGIGEALMEGMRFDPDGQPLTGSFMDYQIPRADDLPMFGNAWMPTNSPNSLVGAKGIGEMPSIGTPGLVVNAVMDALHPTGVRHIDKPITPFRIWQAIEAVRAG